MTPRGSPRRSMKLYPMVAVVQGNAWLPLLPASLLCVCLAPPATGLRAHEDKPRAVHLLSTNAIVPSSWHCQQPSSRRRVLPGSRSKLGARTLRSAWHFLCWLGLVEIRPVGCPLDLSRAKQARPRLLSPLASALCPTGSPVPEKRSPLPAVGHTEQPSPAL
jgi:hypothetical protein